MEPRPPGPPAGPPSHPDPKIKIHYRPVVTPSQRPISVNDPGYGYITYSEPGRRPHRLAPCRAPAWEPGGRPGSVLGGTGAAVSRRVTGEDIPAARAHLRRLLAEPVQAGLVPRAGGQAALRAVWESEAVNADCGDFYRLTRATLDRAWVRPRFPGWIAFQDQGSAIVREGLRGRAAPEEILRELRAAFRARCLATGPPGP